MRTLEKWKPEIERICREAIEGSMSIEEFYRQWPDELKESKFARLIYEDIEDGIQHFPAKLVSGKPDQKVWLSSDMYRSLVITKEVLKMDIDESAALRIRDLLLNDRKLPLDEIAARASELKSQAPM